jgi:hypothetical protein
MKNTAVNRKVASSYVKPNSGYPPQKPRHGRNAVHLRQSSVE